MQSFTIIGPVRKFPGPSGWHYLPLDKSRSASLRPKVHSVWPALLPVTLRTGNTTWKSAIMPIKEGPLFVALPAKVRKQEEIIEGKIVTIIVSLDTL